jgi:hypothetical protein
MGVVVLCPPLVYISRHQVHFSADTSSFTLSPVIAEIGMNFTSFLMV